MASTEAQPHEDSELPYVSELARTLETYSEMATVNSLDTNQIADLLLTLTKAAEFAQTEVGRLGLVAKQKGVGPHMSARSTGEWLAHKTRTTPGHAHRLIARAETAESFASFYFAHDDGKISGFHIDHITRVWRKHPDLVDCLVRDQQVLADAAKQLSPAEFGQVVDRWLMYMQPEETEDDYAKKQDARYLDMSFDLGQNLLFDGQLDPVTGEGFERLVSRRAQELFYEDWAIAIEENDTRLKPVKPSKILLRRSHAQRRADALVSLVIDGSSTPADAQRPEPLILLGVDEHTISDAINDITLDTDPDDAPSPTEVAFDPSRRCETGRGTPLPPRVMLKHFLTDRIRRIVVDPNGVIIDAGRATRLFTPTQRDILKFRDKTCRFPSCTIDAYRCEADHLIEFVDGGETNVANGHMLCRHHHRLKTRGRFFVVRNKDGTVTFATPRGARIV